MAVVVGLVFVAAYLLAPGRGLVAGARRRARQRRHFAERMLVVHLLSHEGEPDYATTCRPEHLVEHLRWTASFAQDAVARAVRAELVSPEEGVLRLTTEGRSLAARAIEEL